MELIGVFFALLPPVFIIAGFGYLFRKTNWVSESFAQGLSFVTINLCLPAFVFLAISSAKLDWKEFLTIAGSAWLIALVQCILGLGVTRWTDPITRSALLLLAIGGNYGNFGTPLTDIAFGGESAAYAMIYYVAWTILFQPLAGYITTRSDSGSSVRASLLKVAKMPLPYAAIVGLIWNYFGLNPMWSTALGKGIFKLLTMSGSVAPFTMLFILGTGLYRANTTPEAKIAEVPHKALFGCAIAMRLLSGLVIAFAITSTFPIQQEIAKVIKFQSAMPAAVQALLIAEALGVPGVADYVRKGLLWTTMLSPIYIPLLVMWIR